MRELKYLYCLAYLQSTFLNTGELSFTGNEELLPVMVLPHAWPETEKFQNKGVFVFRLDLSSKQTPSRFHNMSGTHIMISFQVPRN